MNAKKINNIFRETIADYHLTDHVDHPMPEKYQNDKILSLLYLKNWIDTVQWHLEDIIRDPENDPKYLVEIKRRIDASNQHRTDTVEQIDEYLFEQLKDTKALPSARMNSETPAWLLDRMSILQLKIYHFEDQLKRADLSDELRKSVSHKLAVLKVQENDLEVCFDELMEDLLSGKKYMKLYKQMKMYNDPNLNPVFYNKK
jgi:DNA repair ATPase RecN